MAQLCELPGLKSPNVPHREATEEKQSGSEALPDGESSHGSFPLRTVSKKRFFTH